MTVRSLLRHSITTLSLLAAQQAFAFDAACEALVQASEAKIAQPAWHAIARIDELQTEVIKADGKFFMNTSGEWITSPMNLDDMERETIASMRSGKIRVFDCRSGGNEIINGVDTRVLTYRVEIVDSGMPASDTRINIGTSDNLPYRLGSTAGETRQSTEYRYVDVHSPVK